MVNRGENECAEGIHTNDDHSTHLQQRRLHNHPVIPPRVDQHAPDREVVGVLVRCHAPPQAAGPVVQAEGAFLDPQEQDGAVELRVGLGGNLWRSMDDVSGFVFVWVYQSAIQMKRRVQQTQDAKCACLVEAEPVETLGEPDHVHLELGPLDIFALPLRHLFFFVVGGGMITYVSAVDMRFYLVLFLPSFAHPLVRHMIDRGLEEVCQQGRETRIAVDCCSTVSVYAPGDAMHVHNTTWARGEKRTARRAP